jgi:DUF1707 SHOCT-like domain
MSGRHPCMTPGSRPRVVRRCRQAAPAGAGRGRIVGVTDPSIRAGDTDRDRVAEQLREHYAAGRLSDAEMKERLDVTYAAKTFGDLNPLLADLPALPGLSVPASPQPLADRAAARTPADRGWYSGLSVALRAGWAAWLAAVSVNLVIWALVSIANGDLVYFWPMWVAGPWGAVLLAGTFAHRTASDGGHDHRDRRRQ